MIFGMMLLISLQVAPLVDHYQQFLSGLYESTKWQVEALEKNAEKHQYPNVRSMISHHQQNNVASVRKNADQQWVLMNRYDELSQGMEIFKSGHFFEKLNYMLEPSRALYLKKTLSNFKPAIPLTKEGIVFGFLLALILNHLIMSPFYIFTRRKCYHVSII